MLAWLLVGGCGPAAEPATASGWIAARNARSIWYRHGEVRVVLDGRRLDAVERLLTRCTELPGNLPTQPVKRRTPLLLWLSDNEGRVHFAEVFNDETLDLTTNPDGTLVSPVRRRDLHCPGVFEVLGVPREWGAVPPEIEQR